MLSFIVKIIAPTSQCTLPCSEQPKRLNANSVNRLKIQLFPMTNRAKVCIILIGWLNCQEIWANSLEICISMSIGNCEEKNHTRKNIIYIYLFSPTSGMTFEFRNQITVDRHLLAKIIRRITFCASSLTANILDLVILISSFLNRIYY